MIVDETSQTQEVGFNPKGGCGMLLLILLAFAVSILLNVMMPIIGIFFLFPITIPLTILCFVLFFGLFTVDPNIAIVLIYYGKYDGTIRKNGFFWCNPLYTRRYISLKSSNYNGPSIKVNDKTGNPIDIAAVVVWKVKDTAKAVFDVDNYSYFVSVQYESAIRRLAMAFPYDSSNPQEITLRSGNHEIISFLENEMQERLQKAGIKVEEAKITNLSYSSEIAGIMLKRQQAEAVIAAREKIVVGAVGIIGTAVNSIEESGITRMSNDEKAKLVSGLLITLCSESQVQPVLSTGAIH